MNDQTDNQKLIQQILEHCTDPNFSIDHHEAIVWARKHHTTLREIEMVLTNNDPDYRACWGCEHIWWRYGGPAFDSPCKNCSRYVKTADNFEPASKNYKSID